MFYICVLICSYLRAAVSVVLHLVVLFRNVFLHYHLLTFTYRITYRIELAQGTGLVMQTYKVL